MPRRNLSWLVAVTALCLVCWQSVRSAPEERYKAFFALFADAVEHVSAHHVDPPDRQKLLEGALRGITRRLDRYSSYISPSQLTQFREAMRQEFGGIGIKVEMVPPINGRLTVRTPMPGTPAQKAGIWSGDRIVEIEGKSTEGILMPDAVAKLKGPPGTQVSLAVLHEGATEPLRVTLTRATIHVDTVRGYTFTAEGRPDYFVDKENKIGYLRIEEFHEDTAEEVKTALKAMREQGMRGLIADVRFDPGGLLTTAVEVCDLFIAQGRIVSTKARDAKEIPYDAHKPGTFEGFPMVVLINRFSASASEIFGACLQDHNRAVLIGERTWGKGSVQNIIGLGNNQGAMKLTTASYHRPSGKNIHRFDGAKEQDDWGVRPNEGFQISLADPKGLEGKNRGESTRLEMQAMAEYDEALNRREIIPRPGQSAPTNHFTDRQLQRALEHLRSVLTSTEQASRK